MFSSHSLSFLYFFNSSLEWIFIRIYLFLRLPKQKWNAPLQTDKVKNRHRPTDLQQMTKKEFMLLITINITRFQLRLTNWNGRNCCVACVSTANSFRKNDWVHHMIYQEKRFSVFLYCCFEYGLLLFYFLFFCSCLVFFFLLVVSVVVVWQITGFTYIAQTTFKMYNLNAV